MKRLFSIIAVILSITMLLTSCIVIGDDSTSETVHEPVSVKPASEPESEKPQEESLPESSMEPSSEPEEEEWPDYSYHDEDAKRIFTDYMNNKKNAASDEDRIDDFEITYLEVRDETEDGFVFYIEYSILPSFPEDYLIIGNGEEGENGWINGIGRYFTVEKAGEDFVIKSISMSPSF